MYIQKIRIQNFKSYENIIFYFNKDINIFTGTNNSGKTTVLEAIALWYECFDKLLAQVGRADKKKNIKKGDFVLGSSQPKYIPYTEIVSVRIPAFQDIFYNLTVTEPITLVADLFDPDYNTPITIGFNIKIAQGNLYEINLYDYHKFDFAQFNLFFKMLPDAINLAYTSPISQLKAVEDFETLPKIKLLTHSRASVSVLRNRIYQLKKNPIRYGDFMKDLHYILHNSIKEKEIYFDFIGDETRNTQLIINIQIGMKDIPKEISLLGSGTLQIIEILLGLYEIEKDFNLILLDEPDSHIHRDIQKRLLEIFMKFSDNLQVFLTTHNEALIRNAAPDYLFHIEAKPQNTYRNISFDLPKRLKKGLQPTPYLNIINAISGNHGLDFINALESDKIILVEGDDDAKYISILLKVKMKHQHFKYVYWSFEGVGGLYTHIMSYKDIFSAIKNKDALWQKCVLIFDKDYWSLPQKELLQTKLNQKLGIPVYIGQSYTFESSILTDIPKFKDSIYRYISSKLNHSTLNWQEMSAITDGEIQKIIAQKQTDFENDAILDNKIRLQNGLRKKLINPPLEIKLWQTDEFGSRTTFKIYAQSVLSISAMHQLANKDDVEAIIHGICQNYGLSFSITEDFAELLTMIVQEKTNWFPEWDNIIKLF